MAKDVTLTIDGQSVTVSAGMLIVDAAKKIGIDIPVFCYHPKMEPVGMCRMCLVDIGRPAIDRATNQPVLDETGQPKIQFGPKLDTACTTPVSDGMVIVTQSQKVVDARREMLEFILTSHPLDCPICDKGGECPLQNLTLRFGPGQSRFLLEEKMHLAKHVPLGDLIYLDRERCIQCARCVRFQSDLAGDPVIGFNNRGRALEIVTFSEPGFNSYFSGNTTDICPVGALTTADFRFEARPWELKPVASICPHCPVGCNLTVNVRREASQDGKLTIKRIMPRQNEAVNEIWICDKGRFSYHYAESKERLIQPLVRKNGELVTATWDEAIQAAADGIREAGEDFVAFTGGRLPNEDLFNLRKLSDARGGKALLYTCMGGGEMTAQVGLASGSNLADLGKGSAILVIASDLHEERANLVLAPQSRGETRRDTHCCRRPAHPPGALRQQGHPLSIRRGAGHYSELPRRRCDRIFPGRECGDLFWQRGDGYARHQRAGAGLHVAARPGQPCRPPKQRPGPGVDPCQHSGRLGHGLPPFREPVAQSGKRRCALHHRCRPGR